MKAADAAGFTCQQPCAEDGIVSIVVRIAAPVSSASSGSITPSKPMTTGSLMTPSLLRMTRSDFCADIIITELADKRVGGNDFAVVPQPDDRCVLFTSSGFLSLNT